RGSLAVLVLVVGEFLLGMYVNLFGTIPPADHGHSVGNAITNGPAILTTPAAIGLLLALAAVGVLPHAAMAHHPGRHAAPAAGPFALAFASAAGASFTNSGHPADSMAMSVLTGAGLLCYAANLYLLPPPGRHG